MTERKKPFALSLAGDERRLHSLNILLADYEPIVDLARDEALLELKQPCRVYGTRDFADSRFYKSLTMSLGPVDATQPPPDGGGDAGAAAEPAVDGDATGAYRPDTGSYFATWACCLPVEGHTRSIVCDLQRSTFAFIPNVVAEILELCKTRSVGELYAHYDHQHDRAIDEYLAYLVAHDFGFYCAEPQRFPELSLDWRNPKPITNCVIDFDADTEQPLASLSEQLSRMFCQAVELRFFRAASADELANCAATFSDSTIRSISLLAGDHPSLDRDGLEALLRRHKRIKHIAVHSTAGRNEVIRVDLHTTIRYTSEVVSSEACCGQVSPRYFSPNVDAFTEALQHNSCLSHKVSVDARGAIKNCPSMVRSFGDVRTTPLAQVVASEPFQAPWRITKDQVLVCQDCEFRYICHDCRAYVADPEQPLSKPAKCRYNPYEGRWE